ncbi:MAG: hypothetical protein O3C45_00130 [Bacteroidetes bacterium]|nr:hypothetical protein [Bacteroidota bacterium]MDA0873449.1 hypothetical protein [Bacteroidota bacterium]
MQHAVFITFGLFSVSQELSAMAMAHLADADPELLAEESLSLAAAATSRAIEATAPSHQDLADALMVAPFLYRDYLVGTAMLESGDATQAERGADIGQRLERKMAFYATHLPKATLPTGSVLRNAMLLWMGRISPPGMPTGPEARLDACGAVPRLQAHVRLTAAHLRHTDAGS